MFAVTYLRDKVLNWFESHLIDYLKKFVKNKKTEIKRIFFSYTYFKKCIWRIYKKVDEERTAEWEI